jgi:4-hydroxy-tetrahydrodipicolinate synthase
VTPRPTWTGILPSLPTFFEDAGEIAVDPFVAVARFAADAGAGGLVVFGLAGEVSRLTGPERERLLEALVPAVPDVPVLAGVTAEHLGASQGLARHAERTGAAGVVVPPPTAYTLEPEDLVDFYVAVAGATELPVIVQDAPEYLGVRVGPEAVLRAAERAPNVRAVKLETGAEGIDAWRRALGDDFAVYGGNGGMYLLDALRAGADGIMPGADTVDLQVRIAAAELEQRHEDADAAFERLLPMLVYEMQSMDHYNACAKHVLRRRGLDVPKTLRAPGQLVLSEKSATRLDGYIDRLELAAPVGVEA